MEFSGYPAEFATRVTAVLGAGLEASIAVSHHGAMVRAGSAATPRPAATASRRSPTTGRASTR